MSSRHEGVERKAADAGDDRVVAGAGPDRVTGVADLHVHTHHSDGADSPLDVLHWATRIGLDVLAITDHDTIDGAVETLELSRRLGTGPEVIVGEEVSSRDGHILALFISERIRPDMPATETVDAVHDQGGLAIAAHPYWRFGTPGRNGREYSVGDAIADVEFDAIEVMNGGFTPSMVRANFRAARAARRLVYTPTGGSDAHVKHALGWAHTTFPGRGARDLRRAIGAGKTRAGRSRLELVGIQRYAVWSIGRLSAQPVAG